VTGVDRLPQSFIKSAFSILGPFIRDIFNESLRTSTFPELWNQSIVIALNKVPSPTSLSDFRPISLLCFLSKILERLVHDQISAYVESEGLMDALQTGFRAGHSTQTTLLKLTDDIRQGMDRRLVTALLLFDFSKAFDSVCHEKLLVKLRSLGFKHGALRWVASYLSGRSQAVLGEGNNVTSFLPLNKGVPQGSVLGPLLFSLFVIDIAQGLDSGIRHIIYADDLQINVQGRFEDVRDTLARLSEGAEHISDWAVRNHLTLNIKKTKAMIFGTPVFVNRFNSLGIASLDFCGSSVPFVSHARNLGVVIDSKLNWKEHVAYICKRVNTLMYRLNHFRRSTTIELRKHLIQTLLFPLVDYCSVVYCNISDELNLVLQRVLNRGIRYIYGIQKCERVTPLRRELG